MRAAGRRRGRWRGLEAARRSDAQQLSHEQPEIQAADLQEWDLVLAHEYSAAARVGKFPATVSLARRRAKPGRARSPPALC